MKMGSTFTATMHGGPLLGGFFNTARWICPIPDHTNFTSDFWDVNLMRNVKTKFEASKVDNATLSTAINMLQIQYICAYLGNTTRCHRLLFEVIKYVFNRHSESLLHYFPCFCITVFGSLPTPRVSKTNTTGLRNSSIQKKNSIYHKLTSGYCFTHLHMKLRKLLTNIGWKNIRPCRRPLSPFDKCRT